MIEFPLDTLRAVANATWPQMAYWRELFDSDAAERGTSYISLGVVAVVINAAIEAGVVRLCADDGIATTEQLVNEGYAQGYQHGYAEAKRVLSYQQGARDEREYLRVTEPQTTGDGVREAERFVDGDEDDEDTPLGPDFDDPNPLGHPSLMADAPAFDYTPHPPSKPLIPRRQLPDADLCREKLATALAAGTPQGETLRAEMGVIAYDERGVLIDPGKLKRTMSQHGTALPTVTELIAKVQELAMAGVMPSMSSFNLNKPANWASATAHTERLGLSWSELAAQANLTPNPCLPGKAG